MDFTINKRIIKSTGEQLIGDNADYEARFTFDSEWDGQIKTAKFIRGEEYAERILIDNKCTVPVELLKQGILKVGVFSAEMATTSCEVYIRASIKEKTGVVAEPTPDVYAQIIEMIQDIKSTTFNPDQYYTKAEIEELIRNSLEVSKSEENDESETLERKAIITIIDDDGTARTEDTYTGMRTWLNERNIPLTYAVPKNVTSINGYVDDLLENGNEIVVHGLSTGDNYNTGYEDDLEQFEADVVESKEWAVENGYPSNICVYPCGMQPNKTVNYAEKMAILKKYFDYGFTVNTAVEGSSVEGYEGYYNEMTKGRWNAVPFTTMPDGYSKAMLLNRLEVTADQNMKYSWWTAFIDNAIANQGYLCIFTHSFSSSFLTEDSEGNSGYTRFQDVITYIIETYGEQVEFLTASQALERIEQI